MSELWWVNGCNPEFREALIKAFEEAESNKIFSRVMSCWREPTRQQQMRDNWDAGKRAGLICRPADPKKSDHCKVTKDGKPNSYAVDLHSTDFAGLAVIMKKHNIGWGQNFPKKDIVHFYWMGERND